MPAAFCSRPHPKFITPDMRFVVKSSRGVHTGTADYKQGDEFPGTAVNARTLVQLYDQFRIDLHPEQKFPLDPPRETSRAEVAEPAPSTAAPRNSSKIDLDALSKNELAVLAKKYGVNVGGTKEQLRSRIAALVG